MMASKPGYVDVRSKFFGGNANSSTPARGFLSPRMHVAGDIPPDLSPLDAFAAQSRLLAQQLEEKSYDENRISRQPLCTETSSSNQDQNEYLKPVLLKLLDERPLSPASPSSSGQKTKIEEQIYRHMSIHPTVCGPYDINEDEINMPPNRNFAQFEQNKIRSIRPISPEDSEEYFSAQIQQQTPPSPQSSPPCLRISRECNESQGHFDIKLTRHSSELSLVHSNDSSSCDPTTLAPRNSTFAQRSPSPYSLSTDSSDEDCNMSCRRLTPTESQLSENINVSTPMTSTSYLGRSSSISSDASFSTTRTSNKPSPFNFSRPLVRTSIPHEFPTRHVSPDSNRSLSIPIDENENTPLSTHCETFLETSMENNPVPSYVYAKYALPRGKTLKRNSAIFQAPSLVQNSTSSSCHHESEPSSSLIRSVTPSLGQKASHSCQVPSASVDIPRPSTSSSASSRPSFDASLQLSDTRSSSKEVPTRPKSSTEHLLKPKLKSSHPTGSSTDLSAIEHVEKAIEYHQAGALNKSTYHFRLAARMSHPTGMLLYALACRHGWGMRPNQREGIAWLRRAVDEAGLKVADDENSMQAGKEVDMSQLKSKKAQFALSIYELGVSHMNGWGIEQDKALGLRCFEIAGSWGDADAMAEAGFCYAKGVGCKKDLKKSARFYRMAEARGINMIGNSWIYKAKYNDDTKSEKLISEYSKDGYGKSSTACTKEMKLTETHNKCRSKGFDLFQIKGDTKARKKMGFDKHTGRCA